MESDLLQYRSQVQAGIQIRLDMIKDFLELRKPLLILLELMCYLARAVQSRASSWVLYALDPVSEVVHASFSSLDGFSKEVRSTKAVLWIECFQSTVDRVKHFCGVLHLAFSEHNHILLWLGLNITSFSAATT